MAASYLFGTYLYATQKPEANFPGKFDLFGKETHEFSFEIIFFHGSTRSNDILSGCSHNVFHIFVVGGVVSHLIGVTNLRDLRQALGSNCTDLPDQ